tara:strand:- start:222 stop:587 length:366 start_codon:yes stop_codon:yes gene_type:complete
MLTQIQLPVASSSSSSGAVAQPETQVAATSSTASTILYTVPEGRKAEVYFGHDQTYANPNDYYLDVDVGGTIIKVQGGLSMQSAQYRTLTTPLITLLAGTVVKTRSGLSYAAYILGVEKDA